MLSLKSHTKVKDYCKWGQGEGALKKKAWFIDEYNTKTCYVLKKLVAIT